MRWGVSREKYLISQVNGRARMFGGGQGTTTSISNQTPWSGAQPYLSQGYQGASNLYQAGGPQYYPGSTYASPTQGQLQGLQDTVNKGIEGTWAGNAGINALDRTLDPSFLNSNPANPALSWFANGNAASSQNPYFQQMADTVRANVQPALQAPFSAGNRLDSGLASRALGQGLGDSIGGLAYQNYQTGLGQALTGAAALGGNYNTAAGQQIQGIGQAPNINNMTFSNLAQAVGAGTSQQGLNQNLINDAMARYNYQQNQPYQNLGNFIGNISGNPASKFGSTTSTQPYFSNPMGNILGGIGGASALNNMGMFGSGGLSGLLGLSGGSGNSGFFNNLLQLQPFAGGA